MGAIDSAKNSIQTSTDGDLYLTPTTISQTEATSIINRLAIIENKALSIKEKAFQITLPSTDEKRPERGRKNPTTFVDQTKDVIEDIDEILRDALAALRAFI